MRYVFYILVYFLLFMPIILHSFCFDQAGRHYGISPALLWAIAKRESSLNPSAIHYNKNGSFDVGLMQINSRWYPVLGHERWMMLGDACHNVMTGAWILSLCIQRYGYTWQAVGCYNASSRQKQEAYARNIYSVLTKTELYR